MDRHTKIVVQRQGSRLAGALGVLLLLGLAAGVSAEHDGGAAKPPLESGITSYAPVPDLSGRFAIAGSNTMQPLLAKLATEFTRRYPGVRIVVEDVGSTDAIKEFIFGYSLQRRGEKARTKGHNGASEVNVLASSRELTQKEIASFASANGYEPVAIPVAMDAVTIYVHRDNPIQGLTLAQIDAIFGTERKRGLSGDITTWGQAGLRKAWQDQPIHLYGRDKTSGTRDFFKTAALLDGDLKEEIKEQHGSASEIVAIARDPLGIGYAGIGFQASFVRAVPVAEESGKPYVSPNTATILDGSYPLRRHLYLYVDKAPKSKLDPIVEEFLKFANSQEGQQTVVRADLYPLSKQEIDGNLATLFGGPAMASIQTGSGSN